MVEQGRSPLGQYRSDLRNVVGPSASAYGYTLTIWSTGMVLSHAYGPPSPPLVFSFFFGAVVGFAAVGILAFVGVSAEFGAESSRIRLWGSFRFLSVGLAVGAAWFASAHTPSFPGWPLGRSWRRPPTSSWWEPRTPRRTWAQESRRNSGSVERTPNRAGECGLPPVL
jgi:hypothetical protein